MNARTAYLIQIIEKIGRPLLDAVSQKSGEAASSNEAQHMAELLSKTVKLSIDLGKMIEIEKSEPEQSDSLRIALAGLASPIIADQYRNLSKTPSDADLQKLSSALEAVMTFSDNFTPTKENADRLKNLNANGLPSDAHQINIQYIQAFTSVAHIIASFPFGQAEKKMVQEAAEKITGKAKEITSNVFGTDISEDDKKLAELALVKSLAEMYTLCHKAEMDKLMAIQEPDANSQINALKTLWDGFDARAIMLETLAVNLVPKSASSGASASGSGPATSAPAQQQQQPSAPPVAPPPIQPPPIQPPPQESGQEPATSPIAPPPTEAPPETPPAQQQTAPPPQAAQAPAGGNPMSMFAKPKQDDGGGTPAAPPAQEQPPAAPPAAPPTTPPPTEQQQQPPAAPEQPQEEEKGESGGGGGPMSFFKAPPKDEG